MRFFISVGLLFYVLIISLAAGITLLFIGHVIVLTDVTSFLNVVYSDDQVRGIVGGVSAALIFLSFIFARVISGGRQKERTIAFDNSSGRVSVSLGAVEDLIRRLMYKLAEIKEAKLHIIATKKGIEVETRLILKADVNIPDLTARLQDLVKSKIQEILGIEEAVIVRIHVIKIISEENKSKRSKDDIEEKPESTAVPFHGYRR